MTLLILFVYLVVVFIGSRLIIPYLGFKRTKLPPQIPPELFGTIRTLNQSSKDNLDFLKNSYNFVTSKYYGDKLMTFTKFWYLFKEVFSSKPGYLPCTLQNHILRLMLVKSGRFNESEIEIVVVPFNLIIHQYLEVKIDDNRIKVDPWSKSLGKPFGERSFLFG